MNNVGEKYLPIGTVVMLQGGTKRVMITGFCSMAAEDQSQMFDYSGCMYPEGFLSSDQTALFNHNQIAQVYHMGLVDDEEKKFKQGLNALVAQMNGANNNATVVQPVPEAQPVVVPQAPVVQQPVDEIPVPPIGPGLPGYVPPVIPVPEVSTPVVENVVNDGIVAPDQTQSTPTFTNIQFDENGVVISA